MARPKKDRELQHKHQIMLRLTDTEYEIVSEKAKATHLPVAEYVRKQVMKQTVTAKYEIVADPVWPMAMAAVPVFLISKTPII